MGASRTPRASALGPVRALVTKHVIVSRSVRLQYLVGPGAGVGEREIGTDWYKMVLGVLILGVYTQIGTDWFTYSDDSLG